MLVFKLIGTEKHYFANSTFIKSPIGILRVAFVYSCGQKNTTPANAGVVMLPDMVFHIYIINFP